MLYNLIKLVAGLRLDYFSQTGMNISGTGSIVVFPAKSTMIKFLVRQNFRNPSIYELHYRDNVTMKENPDLESEKNLSGEMEITQSFGETLLLNLDFFYSRITNLIDAWLDPSDGKIQYKNLNDVQAYGGEINLKWRIGANAEVKGGYQYQHSHLLTDDADLPNSPHHSGVLSLKGSF